MSFEVAPSGPSTPGLFSHELEDAPDGYYLKMWRSHTAEALKICGLHEFFGGLCADISGTRSFEAEGVYKHIAAAAKESTAVWLGRTANTPTSVSKLLALQKSSTTSIGGSELPFFQLHSRLVQLAQMPCQAYREQASWNQRQQTMREFLTGPRMQTGIAILDAVRDRRAGPVDGFYRLKEDPRSYLHPVDGLFVHVWHDAGEGRRFISCAQKLWQTIFEHRIRGVACPISAIMQAKGTCITFTLLPPLADTSAVDSSGEGPNAAREIGGLLAQLVGTTFEASRNAGTSVGQLSNAHMYAGTDGRYYLTLPTVFGASPEDMARTGELRRTPLRLEYFNDMFPKGTLATYTVGDMFSRIRQSCIARASGALLSLNVAKTLELVMQGVVPNVMKANGVNTRFMFLLYAETVRASQKTPPHVAVTSAIECEMLCRGIKCLVRGELAGSFYDDDKAYLNRLNRLMKTIATGSPNMWQQLIEVVKERFNCNAPLNIPFHPRLMKVFVWYLGSRLGVTFNPEKAAFDSLQMGSTPNSSFFLVPDAVRFNNAQRKSEASELVSSARSVVERLPTERVAERECRRLRLAFIELMIGIENAQAVLDVSNVLFEQRQAVNPVHLLSLTSFTVELQGAVSSAGSSVLQSTALQLARQTLEGVFFPSGLLRDAPRDNERQIAATLRQNRYVVADFLLCWRRSMILASADGAMCTAMLTAAASCLLSSNAIGGLFAAPDSSSSSLMGDEGKACLLPADALDLSTNAALTTELFALGSSSSFHVGLTVLLTYSLFPRRDVHMPRDLLTWRRRAIVLLFDACLSKPRPEDAAKLQVLCDATLHLHVKPAKSGQQKDPEHCMGALRTALCALRCLTAASPEVMTSAADMFRQLNKFYSDTPIVEHQGYSVAFFDPKDGSTLQALALINSGPFSTMLSALMHELLAQKEYQKALLVQTIMSMYQMPRSLKLVDASKEVDLHVRSCNVIKSYWRRAATGQGFDVNSEQFHEAMAKQRLTRVRMAAAYAAGLMMSFQASMVRLQRLALLDAEDLTRLGTAFAEQEERDKMLIDHRMQEADFALDFLAGDERQRRLSIVEEESLLVCESILHPLLLHGLASAVDRSVKAEGAVAKVVMEEQAARYSLELQDVEEFAEATMNVEQEEEVMHLERMHQQFAAVCGVSFCLAQECAARSVLEAETFDLGTTELCAQLQMLLAQTGLSIAFSLVLEFIESTAMTAMMEVSDAAFAEMQDSHTLFLAKLLGAKQGHVATDEESRRCMLLQEFAASFSVLFEDYYVEVRLAAVRAEERVAFKLLRMELAVLDVTAPEAAARDAIYAEQIAARCFVVVEQCKRERFFAELSALQDRERVIRLLVGSLAAAGRAEIIGAETPRLLRAVSHVELGERCGLVAMCAVHHQNALRRLELTERVRHAEACAASWRSICEMEERRSRKIVYEAAAASTQRLAKTECMMDESRARAAVVALRGEKLASLLALAVEQFGYAMRRNGLVLLQHATENQEALQRSMVVYSQQRLALGVLEWEEGQVRMLLEEGQLTLMSTSRRSLKLSAAEEVTRLRLTSEEAKLFAGFGQLYIVMKRVAARTFHKAEPLLPSAKHLRHLQRVVGYLPPSPKKQAAASPQRAREASSKKPAPTSRNTRALPLFEPVPAEVSATSDRNDSTGREEDLSFSLPTNRGRDERSSSFGVFTDESMASFERRLVTFLERRPTFIAKVHDEKIKSLEAFEETVRYQLEEEHADAWLRLVGGGQTHPHGESAHENVDTWFRAAEDPAEKFTGFQEVLLQEAELTPTREANPDDDLMSPTALASSPVANSPHFMNWPEFKRMRRVLQVKEHLAREVVTDHHAQWFRDVQADWVDAKKLYRDFINHRCRVFVLLLPFPSSLCLPPVKSVTDPRAVARHEALRHALGEQRRLVQVAEERFTAVLAEEELAMSKLRTKFKSRILLHDEARRLQLEHQQHQQHPVIAQERYARLFIPPADPPEEVEEGMLPPDHRSPSFRRCPKDSPRLRSYSTLCLVPDEADVELSEIFTALRRVLGITRTADEVPFVERKMRLKFVEVEFRCRSRLIEQLPKQQQMRKSFFVSPAKANTTVDLNSQLAFWSPAGLQQQQQRSQPSPFHGELTTSVSSLSPIPTAEPARVVVASSPVGGRFRRDLREPYASGDIPKYCDKRTAQLQQIRLEQQRQRTYAAAGISKMPPIYHCSSPTHNKASPKKKVPLPAINNSY